MSDRVIEVQSLQDTENVGRQLGATLEIGCVLALVGPLGSGKTTLVKSIAAGAGVSNPRAVNSPTFVLVNEYETDRRQPPLNIFHIDVYRLRGGADLESLGFEEMCVNGAVLVEWADRVADVLPADYLSLTIEPLSSEGRRFEFRAKGPMSKKLLSLL